ncbi:DUF3788 domain-containing protein [Clostridium sporogenes]|uniref:DUF3788 domain-containing protein n=1 Tax=Clostridium sporogenes TaxID=1509 RepID=UPI0022389DB0|nr:DUF3788 domain-containing protein [Clostridium sporogenes]EKS4345357.1 DUF3788 family protein [Clostridium botulinum]EKS4394007.1 DUF3788 family protein [Clostridium botulinum]MCW6080268.1 DUF3788 domain-containing protein [Clostridium sporogenes]
MDLERMYNKEPLPTYDEMRCFIGNSAVKNFDKIVTFIEENYDFNKEIHYGGKNYGVLIRFRRSGKTLLSLFPEKNGFSCVLVYGKKEIEQFESRRDEFSDYMKRIFNDTKHYHDGKWLLIRIQDDKYINELIEMIKIKKKPKKKHIE